MCDHEKYRRALALLETAVDAAESDLAHRWKGRMVFRQVLVTKEWIEEAKKLVMQIPGQVE